MKYGWHREIATPRECWTCGATPCVNPRFCKMCRDYDASMLARYGRKPETFHQKLMNPGVSLDKAYSVIQERLEEERMKGRR